MNEIEEIKKMIERHLGKSTEIELKTSNGKADKFKISPIPTDRLPELFSLMKAFEGSTLDKPSINVTKEWQTNLANLGVEALKPNYPDIEESLLRELVLRNSIVFATELLTQNLSIEKPSITTKK